MVTRRWVVASLCGASRLLGRPLADEKAAGDVITIPGVVGGINQILIRARINGSEPIWSILDSGGSSLVRVNRQTAAAIGLKPSWEGRGSGPDAESMRRDERTRAIVTVAGVNLGAPVVIIAGPGLPGYIGMSLFSRYVVELDYETTCVRLHVAAGVRYSGPGHAIPFSLEPTFDYNPFADTVLTIGDTKVSARLGIDTGCGGCSAWLTKSFVDSHEVFDNFRAFGKYKAAKLSIGPVSVTNPILWLAPKRGFGGGPEPDGLLGVEFLRQFKVFMDYTRSQIILEPNRAVRWPETRLAV